jgi:hypothetical protein
MNHKKRRKRERKMSEKQKKINTSAKPAVVLFYEVKSVVNGRVRYFV